MQNLILKSLVGIVVVAMLLLGVLAIALPRLINSDEFQTTLRESAEDALGTPVEWQSLEVGLLPPRLMIDRPVLVSATGNSEDARVTALSIDLRLALAPILARRIQIDSLVLRGVEIVVTRTEEGFLLPIIESTKDAEGSLPNDSEKVEESPASAFGLALNRIVISESRMIIHDRTLPRSIEWRLEDVEIEAFAAAGGLDGEPLEVELAASLQSGPNEVGRIRTSGTVSLSGHYDLDIELEEFRLAELQAYILDATVAGTMSGRVSLDGAASTPPAIDLDLEIAKLDLQTGELDLAGGLTLRASRSSGDPAEFAMNLDLGSKGQVAITGEVALDSAVDASMKLDALDLAPFSQIIDPDTEITGFATGTVELRVAADRMIERVETELRIESARVVSQPLELFGVIDLVASLEGDRPIRLDVGFELSDGGRLELDGTLTRDGALDVRVALQSVDLAMVRPFLPYPDMQLAGLATGDGRVVGAASSPESIRLDLSVKSGLVRMPDYFVEGPFLASLDIQHPLSARSKGRIDLDLTTARLEYQDQFKKPAGIRAEMVTEFVLKESGEIVFESRVKLRNINEIFLQGAISDSTSVALTTPRFDLENWSHFIPALQSYRLDGVVALKGVSVELHDGAPDDFRGRIDFERVGLSFPDAARLQIQGTVIGDGPLIRSEELRVLVGGMVVGINGKVEDPLNEARFALDVKSVGVAEVNDLLSTLTSTRDRLFGPLQFSGAIEGTAASEADLYASAQGNLEFSIGKGTGGRLRGVSILQTFLDQIPLVGGAARLTRPFRGGRSVDDFFTEQFEIIEGDFEIGQGKVNARTLRLVYGGYEANLSGPIRLRDLTIDMTGEIILHADLISVLGGFAGANPTDREPIRIPLARVTNTLSDPKIKMTAATLAALPKLIFAGTGIDTIAIGVGNVLGRVLGGGEE